jgi:uridine phosphorylase
MASLFLTFAVKEESRPFQKLIGSRSDLRVLLTGIGQRNAEKTIRKVLAEQPPQLVITCGFAGGLNPELATGTVIFSADEDFASPINPPSAPPTEGRQISDARGEFPSWEGSGVGSATQEPATRSEFLVSALLSAGARPAKFHCAKRVAANAEEKRALRQSTGADAVEMESGVIRAICREHNIPSATVRVISDAANEDLPLDFNRLMDADQNLSYSKLALTLLKSPRKVGVLLKFHKVTRASAERLANVLIKIISDQPLSHP